MTDSRIYWQTQPIIPLGAHTVAPAEKKSAPASSDFAKILENERRNVKFSKHALQRLEERNVNFSENQLEEFYDAVDRMEKKGARESLIYMDNVAFIVSVKNRTVITAMDGASAKENIFTNIDSAAIL